MNIYIQIFYSFFFQFRIIFSCLFNFSIGYVIRLGIMLFLVSIWWDYFMGRSFYNAKF